MSILPQSFRFSPWATGIGLVFAAVMIWCSTWQWERYKAKKELVATYRTHDIAAAQSLNEGGLALDELIDRKVSLRGKYDFDSEFIVLNKKHVTGPGQWLVAPFELDGSGQRILVSRGFIPFEDRTAETWTKYSFDQGSEPITIEGVLKRSKGKRLMFSPAADDVPDEHSPRKRWLYIDAPLIAATLPNTILTTHYVQGLTPRPSATFPAPSVSVEVPPSTHFGYTIEWALLALGTLGISFVYQAWPRRRKNESTDNSSPGVYSSDNQPNT